MSERDRHALPRRDGRQSCRRAAGSGAPLTPPVRVARIRRPTVHAPLGEDTFPGRGPQRRGGPLGAIVPLARGFRSRHPLPPTRPPVAAFPAVPARSPVAGGCG